MPHDTHLFGLFLVNIHQFPAATIAQALDIQRARRTPIGKLAISSRLLSMKEVMHVLALQADCKEAFGELAVKAGLLSDKNRRVLLDLQREQQPKLGEILVEMGVISSPQRDDLLNDFHQLMAPVESV